MNRCSQVLSDKCTTSLADFVQKSRPIKIDRLTFNASLKYLLLNDPNIAVEITSPTSFEIFESKLGAIVPNGPAISEARLSDFLLGANRVRKQHDAVLRMRDAGTAAAWLVVSTYYCAYFACIELCKIINRISLSFEEDELASLRIKALGAAHAQFFANGQSNFVGTEYAGKLVFQSVGTKPHSAAWENALHAVRLLLGNKGWPEANQYIELLSNPNYSPSRIRNTWNYRRSDYFGHAGESRAREFRKLVGNPEGASAWLKRTNGRTDPLDPCIIAVLCEALTGAVADASQRATELVNLAAAT